MPLRRTPAALLCTRSFSKSSISSCSPPASVPSSPLRSSLSSDFPLSASRAQIRRAKKATELRNKSTKAKNACTWANHLSPRSSLDLALALNDDKGCRHDDQELDGTFPILIRSKELDKGAQPDDRPQVQLTDLVVTKKPRRKERDGGFEFVPPVRSVIVLDDSVTPELDFDEPWEHIYGTDDDKGTSPPSYAHIASLN